MELEGGDLLSNLTLLNSSLEPSVCLDGNEELSVDVNRVEFMQLLVACTVEFFFTAQVP